MWSKLKDKSGIALAELLLAVSITAIISTISLVGVRYIGKDLNSINADETAKSIFLAASSGMEEVSNTRWWQENVKEANCEKCLGVEMTKKPSDFDYWASKSGLGKSIDDNYVFSKGGTMLALDSGLEDDAELVEKILPLGSIDDDVRNGKYFIEYNAKTAVVYGVFYIISDSEIDYETLFEATNDGGRENESVSMLDAREFRKSIDIKGERYVIGYYGGGINFEEKEGKVTVQISLCKGIKDVHIDGWEKTEDGYKKEINYGEKLTISDADIELYDGYEGVLVTADGDGDLTEIDDKYVFTAGKEDAIISIKAGGLLAPEVSLSGGGDFVFNYKDVPLVASNKRSYACDYGIKINYKLVLLENEGDKDGEKLKEISLSLDKSSEAIYTYLVNKDEYYGAKYYVIYAYAYDEDFTSEQSISEIRKIDFSRVKLKFVAEDGSKPADAKIIGQDYAYIEYGKSEIFESQTGDDLFYPCAIKTVHRLVCWAVEDETLFSAEEEKIFEINNIYENGVFVPASRDEIKVEAVWQIVRQRVDISSGGGFYY